MKKNKSENLIMNKQIVKMVIGLVGKDKIKSTIEELFSDIKTEKNKFKLLEGETDVIAIIYEVDEKVYFASATINDKKQILRIENLQLLEDFILNSINKIK